jgi:RNA polymerase-associated protein RTF1
LILSHFSQERKKIVVKESESESDFGEDDEDSDDDYEETLKPWQKKAQEAKSKKKTKSQLDEYEDEDDDAVMEEAPKTGSKFVKPAELEDYMLVTISRARLAKWCNEPYFEKAVMKGFVKLFVGENEEGKRCYRLCRIVSVDKSKQPYSLPKAKNASRKEKPIVTDKMLKLDFAGTRKVFPLRLVSDNKLTQSDVSQYETAMKTARKQDDLPGKMEAIKLRRKRDELVENFTYTTEDIEKKLKEKKMKGVSSQNLGLEQTRAANAIEAAQGALTDAKARLEDARDGAETNDAMEDVKIAEESLRIKLEQEILILEKVKSRRERNKSRSNNWVDVNERANKLNRLADVGLDRAKNKGPDKTPSGKETFNPYARRKVKPKNLWQVGQGDEKKENDDNKDSEAPTSTKGGANGETNINSTPPLVQEQQGKAAALSQSHQFAIDEETLAQTSFLSGIRGLASKKKSKKRVRKGLSLAEYQERKASGTL